MRRFIVFVTESRKTAAFRQLFSVLFCLLFVGLISCSETKHVSEDQPASPPDSPQSTNQESLEELYWSRVDSAKMQFTQADVDFMIGMIAHHAQALIMSDLAPKNNAGSSIQTLASRIINAQKDEIQSMQQWLRDRNQPVPEVHIDGLILSISMESSEESAAGHQHMQHSHSGSDHSGMPGMLTQEQLNELGELKGDAFDRTFLKYMIEHHRGAVIMVRELFNSDGAALDQQAFRLASDIQVDQITEIERMKLMLKKITASAEDL